MFGAADLKHVEAHESHSCEHVAAERNVVAGQGIHCDDWDDGAGRKSKQAVLVPEQSGLDVDFLLLS